MCAMCIFMANLPKMLSKSFKKLCTAFSSLGLFSRTPLHTQILKELIRVEVEIYIVACDRKCECTLLEHDIVFLLFRMRWILTET